jgi:DNA-binding CsgD family transcriptional regulator
MGATPRLEAILAALERADSLEALDATCRAVRDHFGALHVAYQRLDGGGECCLCGTYPVAWRARYRARDLQRVDPLVLGAANRFDPVDWKSLDWSPRAARALWAAGAARGLGRQGLSLTLRGPGGRLALFTLRGTGGDGPWAAFAAAHRRALVLLAHVLHGRILALAPGGAAPAGPPLSPREAEAMRLLAGGLSRAQAAADLEISEHTLRAYIESARFKLGALNTTHAVARALSRGMIAV